MRQRTNLRGTRLCRQKRHLRQVDGKHDQATGGALRRQAPRARLDRLVEQRECRLVEAFQKGRRLDEPAETVWHDMAEGRVT